MAAGMVPPLAMALATTVRPGLFTEPERENGRAAWLLGASFISEGAIPFAAADPLRVIPSMMFGGAITGALIMAFDVTLRHRTVASSCSSRSAICCWFLVALAVGTVAGALAVIAAKQFAKPSVAGPPNRRRRPALATSRSGTRTDTDRRRPQMPTKTVIVGSAIGLHARPAAIIAEAVVNAGVPVTLSMDGGEPVDAGSALMIMTLGAGNGAQVTVASDDEEVLRTVAELVQQDLDAYGAASALSLRLRLGQRARCARKVSGTEHHEPVRATSGSDPALRDRRQRPAVFWTRPL